MKHLAFLILMAFAIPARSQTLGLTQMNPTGTYRIDSPVIHQANLKIHRRPKGTIGTIVGATGILGGLALFRFGNQNSFWPAFLLTSYGTAMTLACGAVMIGDVATRHHRRYSVVIHPTGIGLAYRF